MPLSGRDNIFQFCFDLNGGEARSVPAAAKRLNEENAGDEALAANYGKFLLVVQQSLLGIDNIEVADKSADVTAGGNV